VLVSTDTHTDKPWEGFIVNRSEGGLRLTTSQEVPVGAVLRVRAINSRESLPWAEVEVKNSRQQPGHWELGCQFISLPPPEVLKSFGSL